MFYRVIRPLSFVESRCRVPVSVRRLPSPAPLSCTQFGSLPLHTRSFICPLVGFRSDSRLQTVPLSDRCGFRPAQVSKWRTETVLTAVSIETAKVSGLRQSKPAMRLCSSSPRAGGCEPSYTCNTLGTPSMCDCGHRTGQGAIALPRFTACITRGRYGADTVMRVPLLSPSGSWFWAGA